MKVTAKLFTSDVAFYEDWEVIRVSYEFGRLEIRVNSSYDDRRAIVLFSDAQSFRVLNERDLNEYWPIFSSPNGWLFEISEGGWLSQEQEREESLTWQIIPDLREFLITGSHDCVSVLSCDAPMVSYEGV